LRIPFAIWALMLTTRLRLLKGQKFERDGSSLPLGAAFDCTERKAAFNDRSSVVERPVS
jgi:hypothetical protein